MNQGSIDSFLKEAKQIIDNNLNDFIKTSSQSKSVINQKISMYQNLDYLQHTEFVGTAHFSHRSVQDILQVINTTKSVGICLELCPARYDYLLNMCNYCLKRGSCSHKCEFMAVIESLKDVKTDIWLIDMNQEEINARVLAKSTIEEAKAWHRLQKYITKREAYGIKLWEEGLKDEALSLFNGDLTLIKREFPTLWQILIMERNILMACRLIHIISQYYENKLTDFKLIVLIGALHVEGIKNLLKNPQTAFELLDQFKIAFSQPNIVRRT